MQLTHLGANIARQFGIVALGASRVVEIALLNPPPAMAEKSARKPNAAFMKPVTPNATLAAVVGSAPLPRTELTKKLWVYIKANGLQDSKVKTQINADEKLRAVFGGRLQVSMFEMTKLVSQQLIHGGGPGD
jgi:chromatin remodeling complex protein RSC6